MSIYIGQTHWRDKALRRLDNALMACDLRNSTQVAFELKRARQWLSRVDGNLHADYTIGEAIKVAEGHLNEQPRLRRMIEDAIFSAKLIDLED